MLKPAILFKEEIEKEFCKRFYSKELRLHIGSCGYNWSPEISITPESNFYQYAIVDDKDEEKLIGYFCYQVRPEADNVGQIWLIGFDETHANLTIGRDVYKKFEELVNRYHRVSWRACGDNPTLHNYIKLCKKFGGDYFVLSDVDIDEEGKWIDEYVFEIINPIHKMMNVTGDHNEEK